MRSKKVDDGVIKLLQRDKEMLQNYRLNRFLLDSMRLSKEILGDKIIQIYSCFTFCVAGLLFLFLSFHLNELCFLFFVRNILKFIS